MADERAVNYVVSNLSDYIATNRDLLIAKFGLLGGGTRDVVTIMTGVKYKEKLNYLDIEPELQDGEVCEFTPQDGGLELSQREITVAPIKVDIDICPRNLRKKYAQYLIRINAVEEGKRLPFEAEVSQGLVDQINKKIETLIWQGDTSSEDTDLKWIDGWLEQIDDDEDTIEVDSMPAGAYDGILAIYLAMPAVARKMGGLIFAAPEIFDIFMQDLVKLNYFHYSGAVEEAPQEFYLPGTRVKVRSTEGLEGSLTIVGTWGKNLVYGTDMEGDEEDLDMWYSKDDRVFKIEALWNSGVSYYFPDQIVYGTFDATPTIGSGANESLAAIATNTATIATNTAALDAVADVMEDVHNEAKHSLNSTATA